jgi:hypothetical protein
MSTIKRTPAVLAMVFCDQVIRDEQTKKITLVGCFTTILANAFPATHRNLGLYVALTDGEGDYTGHLRFTLEETGQELMTAEGKFRLADPLQIAELNFTIPALPLPQPGKYRLEFLCDGEPLMSRVFVADIAKPAPGA